ncbi:MAG: hypothetical protein H6815_05865 [Phycisphaeraceae bacterium]|nr:hypothetical protein [Phycisphaerales bacterium]MCB9859965.1 hypothetical protein [Phycisphaeraceae bacterium]
MIDDLMFQLHDAASGKHWEGLLWEEVVGALPTRLEARVANKLIDRGIAVSAIAHSLADDAVLWRLADDYEEAMLTLAKRRYVNDAYSVDQFAEVLSAFPTQRGRLQQCLMGLDSSDNQKSQILSGLVD